MKHKGKLLAVYILIIIAMLFCEGAFGQVLQSMNNFGVRYKRFGSDSTMFIPSDTLKPALSLRTERNIAILPDGVLYAWSAATQKWETVSATGSNCLDNITVITLVAGTNFPSGDSTYTNASLIGKQIKVLREGEYQIPSLLDGYEYDHDVGKVTFHPWVNFRERINIEYTCDPFYIPPLGSSGHILTQSNLRLNTQSSLRIIIQ